jgi:hypothetical protein
MLEHLDGQYATALILNPTMNPQELMKAIAVEFGLPVNGLDRLVRWASSTSFYCSKSSEGRIRCSSSMKLRI